MIQTAPDLKSDEAKTTDQAVLEAILKAIFEQRIPPGTKLKEEKLAEAFGVGRGRIRRVLLSLSHHRVVELKRNRGAYVARPQTRDARDVFRVRRLMEELIVGNVVENADATALKMLRTHVQSEEKARDRAERHEAIRMAGEFHLLLARISGSRIFRDMMEILLSQSSLIVGLYGTGIRSSCSCEVHGEIVAAIANGDVPSAKQIMNRHLSELEDSLQLDSTDKDVVDFSTIFSSLVK